MVEGVVIRENLMLWVLRLKATVLGFVCSAVGSASVEATTPPIGLAPSGQSLR